jgi:hypothetical protein
VQVPEEEYEAMMSTLVPFKVQLKSHLKIEYKHYPQIFVD